MEQSDRAILDWIAEQTGDPALQEQISSARVKRRDYTRTGVFVYFEADADRQQVPRDVRPVCPRVETAELMDGAGCDLFLRDGRLHYLEVYARGGFLPEQLGEFTLRHDD